jgi:hypothetical protein
MLVGSNAFFTTRLSVNAPSSVPFPELPGSLGGTVFEENVPLRFTLLVQPDKIALEKIAPEEIAIMRVA